ncbi:MAG: Gfo/Idh/MocA family oxidoreductase [Elusimicrobia bacterium]|nr:Gfo/Idh/MocA family oxidoreductase [Elusimicrobiota bacterium]
MAETADNKTAGPGPANAPIRYGVVGLGRMGTIHLEVLKTLEPRINVCALSDTDPKRLHRAKKLFPAAEALPDHKNLAGRVEAVSICTPTETHCAIAEYFLENKIATLVEKPIAPNLTEAEKILWASQASTTHLHIGHIERFNPAIVKAKELIHKPIFIEAFRCGPYEPRVHDIGVILDLMIHDLDLILWILSDLDVQLEDYSGQGLSIISPHEDLAKVRLRFKERTTEKPILVDLTASRLTFDKIRKMRIFQEESALSLDLGNHKLKYSWATKLPLKSLKDIATTSPKLPKTNPLRQELEHFLNSIDQTKATTHDVHPREAWDALELALQLIHSLDKKDLYSKPRAAQAVGV